MERDRIRQIIQEEIKNFLNEQDLKVGDTVKILPKFPQTANVKNWPYNAEGKVKAVMKNGNVINVAIPHEPGNPRSVNRIFTQPKDKVRFLRRG